MSDAARARESMIHGQITPGHVLGGEIIAALEGVPRELFVNDRFKYTACVDADLPLSRHRYLMEPLVFAKLLEEAEIKRDDVVLDVGCGTGYSIAVLARLARRVVGVEEQRELAEKARQMIDELEISNAEIVTGAQISSFGNMGPYDAIIISGGSVQKIPRMVLNQLAEGGRLVAVENIARRPEMPQGLGHAIIMRKIKGAIYMKKIFDASVPLLPGFETAQGFIF